MVKKVLIIAALGAVASSYAANDVRFLGVGSSAMFNTFRDAALSLSASGIVYNITASAIDTSSAGIPNQSGSLRVVVDGASANSRKVWAYLSVDSTVGVRCFFNNAKLGSISAGASGIPQDVIDSINNQSFTAGMTDITPVDAKVATAEAITRGYGIATPIIGAGAGGVLNSNTLPVDFSLSSRAYQLFSVGASPVVVFANKLNTSAGSFGEMYINGGANINRHTLAGFLDGSFKRTRDMSADSTLPSVNVLTAIRESLSGTYNTMEFCVPRMAALSSSQENAITNINVGYNSGNFSPLSGYNPSGTQTYGSWAASTAYGTFTAGGRVRASGTGNLVKIVTFTPNALGYSFWSTGTFIDTSSSSNVSGHTLENTFYLTVDGIDPLNATYSGGNYPLTTPTFANIKNGTYPIWSILRACIDQNASATVTELLDTMTNTNNGGNFVTKSELPVFRSHRVTQFNTAASNGNNTVSNSALVEAGADAGGAVFFKNADTDFYLDTNLELINVRQ